MPDARRWDSDTVGHGVRDAAEARPSVETLLQAMANPVWVAEDPEAHLLPHLLGQAKDLGVHVLGTRTIDGVLELRIGRSSLAGRHPRQLAVELIASVAEASTHIRELPGHTFEIVTGMLPGDGAFAPHGHLLRVCVE